MESQSQNIDSALQISELKQSNLYNSYEQFHSQVSSMLVFSVQWKDLETHFNSTRKSIQTSIETLSEREKAFSLREKEFASREARMESGFESKKKQLENHFSEREKASSLREKELETRESRFESDFVSKKKEFASLETLIGERVREVELAMRQSNSLQTLIVENREELVVKEREFKAIESSIADKSSELDRLNGSVQEQEKKLERAEDCVKVTRGKVFSLAEKVKQLKEEISSKEREVDKEIQSKEDKLKAVLGSIASCSSELESKETRLEFVRKEVESKEKSFVSLKNSADQITRAGEKRVSEIERLSKELELKEKCFKSQVKEFNFIREKAGDCLREVESREKNLESQRNSLDKSVSDLETKERQFEKRVIEFESTRSRVIKVEPLECALNKNSTVICSASNRNSRAMEGRDLRLLLNRHLKTHDSVSDKVFGVLRASANPPKLALDAMQGFYPSNSSEESREFGLCVIRRSCIIMLEQLEKLLMEDSQPPIGCEVRDEAKRFAKNWRPKIKETETNYLEALGFLQFLTSFRLTSEFDPNEIYELREAISTADKAFVVSKIDPLASIMTIPPIFEVNTMLTIHRILEKSTYPARYVLQYIHGLLSPPFPDTNVLLNCIILFGQLSKVSPHIHPRLRDDATRVAADWKESIESRGESTILDISVFLQFLDTYDLVSLFDADEIVKLLMKISRDSKVLEACCKVGIAKRIHETIQYLIGKKNLVYAVRLICAFKLADEYEPAKLLTGYMDDLKIYTTKNIKRKNKKPIEEKERITDEEITALIAIGDCIIENNLDRQKLPLGLINARIEFLENGKVQRRQDMNRRLQALAELPPRKCKRLRGPGGGGFDHHQEQGRHKLPRPPSPV